jgi:hypothetical protein
MPKTAPYQQKADKASRERKKKDGYVYYCRMVKKEWKEVLDKLLSKLKNKDNTNMEQ